MTKTGMLDKVKSWLGTVGSKLDNTTKPAPSTSATTTATAQQQATRYSSSGHSNGNGGAYASTAAPAQQAAPQAQPTQAQPPKQAAQPAEQPAPQQQAQAQPAQQQAAPSSKSNMLDTRDFFSEYGEAARYAIKEVNIAYVIVCACVASASSRSVRSLWSSASRSHCQPLVPKMRLLMPGLLASRGPPTALVSALFLHLAWLGLGRPARAVLGWAPMPCCVFLVAGDWEGELRCGLQRCGQLHWGKGGHQENHQRVRARLGRHTHPARN